MVPSESPSRLVNVGHRHAVAIGGLRGEWRRAAVLGKRAAQPEDAHEKRNEAPADDAANTAATAAAAIVRGRRGRRGRWRRRRGQRRRHVKHHLADRARRTSPKKVADAHIGAASSEARVGGAVGGAKIRNDTKRGGRGLSGAGVAIVERAEALRRPPRPACLAPAAARKGVARLPSGCAELKPDSALQASGNHPTQPTPTASSHTRWFVWQPSPPRCREMSRRAGCLYWLQRPSHISSCSRRLRCYVGRYRTDPSKCHRPREPQRCRWCDALGPRRCRPSGCAIAYRKYRRPPARTRRTKTTRGARGSPRRNASQARGG